VSIIGLYGGTGGARGEGLRLAVAYNGLTLNNPSDTLDGDSGPDTYEINSVAGSTAFDYISEVNQQRDGLEVYDFRKVSRIETLRGVIRAPSQAKLHDKIKSLANAFDPAKISHDNTDPFLALTFSVPTTDTANYATGFVLSQYYAIPLRMPDPVVDEAAAFAAMFDIVMLMKDPRRYWQTQSSQTGAATVSNVLSDYPSPATLTITMAGAGNAAYSATNTTALHGAEALVLDLSGRSAAQVVVVDMERRSIKVDGTETPSIYVSGSYFHIDPVASNVIAYANTTNATSVLTWRRSWSQ